MNRFSTTLFILLFATGLFAQKKVYFDKDWNETSKESALYYRTIEKQGPKYDIKDYYITGEIQFEGLCTNDTDPLSVDGLAIWYHQNGNIAQKAVYTDGIKDGVYESYLSDGTPKGKAVFKNDQLNGPFVEYFDGKVVNKCNMKDGIQEGECLQYYRSEKLKKHYFIKDGLVDGNYLVLGKDGDTMVQARFQKGKALSYHSNFVIGFEKTSYNISMELLDEVEHWKTFREGNLVLSSFYREGKRSGKWELFTYDGSQPYETWDYTKADCASSELQKAEQQFPTSHSLMDRFYYANINFSPSQGCEYCIVTKHYESDDAISEEEHPFHFQHEFPEPEMLFSKIDYKDPAQKPAFLSKNKCKVGTKDFPSVTVCKRKFDDYTYVVFTSEVLLDLIDIRKKLKPSDKEIFFFYQRFEERVYQSYELDEERYMDFSLSKQMINRINIGAVDKIDIARCIEHKFFEVDDFSGTAAYLKLDELCKE